MPCLSLVSLLNDMATLASYFDEEDGYGIGVCKLAYGRQTTHDRHLGNNPL